MTLRVTTLLIAVVLTRLMAHSTPGIRLMIVNFPGVAAMIWAGLLIGENHVMYVVCALVNWAFYFYLAKAALALKSRFLN
jgi:hypothetical protein